MIDSPTTTCQHCATPLAGKYCHACGEKMVEPRDFTFWAAFGQVMDALTNVDAKLWRTLRWLLLRPGRLSEAYVAGVRVPYMRPFQLFLIANVVFFIFMTDIDIFRTPAKWFFMENFDGIRVLDKVRAIEAERGLSREAVALRYDTLSADYAKGFTIALIPFITLVGVVLNWRRRYPVGKHVVFATHYFTFLLLFSVLVAGVVPWLIAVPNRWYFIVPMTLGMLVYYGVATQRFYGYRWPGALWRTVLGFVLVNGGIFLYRSLVSWLALQGI